MEQEVPQPKTMRNFWDLIIGPEASHWRRLLVQDHLGSDGRLALFQACTASRDIVHTTAEQATLKMISYTRGHGIDKALVTRGKLPTKLHLTASGSGQLHQMLGALEEGTTWLDELHVQCYETLPRHAMAIVGRCCPNLRVLDTTTTEVHKLTSPKLFPNLKQLYSNQAIYRQFPGFYRTTAPYIKQLTHFSVWSSPHTPLLSLLFSPGSPGTHLRNLHLKDAKLDDTLLGLVLQGAPAVEELRVSSLHLQSDAHMHTQAQWRKVTFDFLRMTSLAYLPLTPPGLVLVSTEVGGASVMECDVASMEEAVAARLKDVRFRWQGRSDGSLSLCKGEAITEHQAPAALRLALTLLRSWSQDKDEPLDTPRHPLAPFSTPQHPSAPLGTCPVITLAKWTMTTQVMLELQGLPRWKKVDFSALLHWLPEQPELYSTLLRRLPDSYRDITIFCPSQAAAAPVPGLNGPPPPEPHLTPQQVESICVGAPTNRTPEAPLHITLAGCSAAQFEAVCRSMQLCPVPNVVVEQSK